MSEESTNWDLIVGVGLKRADWLLVLISLQRAVDVETRLFSMNSNARSRKNMQKSIAHLRRLQSFLAHRVGIDESIARGENLG